jgi:hypothetical protein
MSRVYNPIISKSQVNVEINRVMRERVSDSLSLMSYLDKNLAQRNSTIHCQYNKTKLNINNTSAWVDIGSRPRAICRVAQDRSHDNDTSVMWPMYPLGGTSPADGGCQCQESAAPDPTT